MAKKYCIIGTSAAGLSAAHKLRQLDKEASILCFTQEKELSYNKCFLADYLASLCEYPTFKTEQFFETNNIEVVTSCTITAINKKEKTITNSDGKVWEYDALLLANGGSLVRPETETASCKNVFDFYTYEQIKLLKEYALQENINTIVIIGGGLSGLECADALLKYNKNIIIIEKAPNVLSHQITPAAASFLEQKICNNNIVLKTNTLIEKFTIAHDSVTAVQLSDGSLLKVDMVVYALGARPNLQLAHDIQLTLEEGAIKVNEFMQTSDASIYAAGDVCRVYNIFTKSYMKNCTWPEAMHQGMYAAHAMAGVEKSYKGAAPIISSHFFGMKFFIAGIIHPLESDSTTLEHSENSFHYIVRRNGKVIGFIIFGDNKLFFELKPALMVQFV